jgi:HEAT repeat protein
LKRAEEEQDARLYRLLLELNEPEKHSVAIPGIRLYGEDAVDPLIKLLSSKDPDARFGAARVLGDLRDKRAIPGLIKATRDENVFVRFWVVDALGKLKAEEAVDAIGKLLRDDDKSIRELARDVLIQIGSPNAMRVLRKESRPKWWLSIQ